MSLKNKIESLLFSSGRRMHIEEIAKLCKADVEEAKQVLKELKKHYDERESSLTIEEEGDYWKITVKEQFLPLVSKIVTKTELDKGTLETLAVIAFKYPILQSDVIKTRTNKAYDHMKKLEEFGYITRQKHGRTRLIKLTQKFFEYFDLPKEKLKEAFKDFEGIARAIEKKEDEIKEIKEEQKKKAEKLKEGLKEQTEVDLIDEKGHKKKLKVYETEEKIIPIKEKLGPLEVVDEPKQEQQKAEVMEEIKELETPEPTPKLDIKKEQKEPAKPKTEFEKEIDSRVEEILHPKEELEQELPPLETTKPEPKNVLEASSEESKEQEPKDLLEVPPEKPKKESKEEPKDLLDASREEKK